MFGSRTTVKKVRNSLTWFSHGSGASLAPEPLVRVPFSATRVFETLFFFELKEWPVWDNPRGQLPGTGIRLHGGNLYGGSAQGVSGTSSGGVAVTGESSSGGRSLPLNC